MQLITDRLLLREFVKEDWPDILAYQSDPMYLRYYAWTQRTEQDVQKFVQRFVAWQKEQPRSKYQLAIVLLADECLIGNCGLRKETVDARQAELGYEIAPGYWGRGYATEAARTMITFGFEVLKLHRIHASCVLENVASARILEKLGMHREGHLRQNQWLKGRWWDTLLYGILAHEWEGSK